jgi:hypothetical protein
VIVFSTTHSLFKVVEKVLSELKWMDISVVVDFRGRYNVWFGHHICWKTMPLNSKLRWKAYKESGLASQEKSFELFSTKNVGARLHIDLNRRASPSDASTLVHENALDNLEADVYTTLIQPPMNQPLSLVWNDHHELDMEGGESEAYLHDDYVSDVEANCMEEEMNDDIPYTVAMHMTPRMIARMKK